MQRIKEILKEPDIEFTEKKIEKMERYMDSILELNSTINLTSIKDRNQFIEKHLIDSLWAAHYKSFINAENVVDIGTGAGFPGIPLAICFQQKQFILVDSLKKKLNIIQDLCANLNIKNVEVLHIRAEEMGHKEHYREKFDCCVSRAVANLSTLSEYCLPLVKIGGTFISYKTISASDEIAKAEKAIRILGGERDMKTDFSPQQGDLEHMLIEIKKIKQTPKMYPRTGNMPRKTPI